MKKNLAHHPLTLLAGLLLTMAGIFLLLFLPEQRLAALAALVCGLGVIAAQQAHARPEL